MIYRGFSDFVKHIAQSDPRLYEALKRIDTSFHDIYKFINDLVLPTLPFEACKLRNSANISVNDVTITTITFDTTLFDTSAMSVTANRITFRAAGKYQVGFNAAWDANLTGFRQIYIQKNGTVVVASSRLAAADSITHEASGVIDVVRDDYIEALAFQNSGGTRTLTAAAGEYTLSFWAHLLSRK